MKKQILTFVLLLMALWACTEMEETCVEDHTSKQISYGVSLSEINRIDFTSMLSPQTKTAGVLSKEITPIVEGKDTLLYIINYGKDEGWVLASADKRTPLIVATSENGSFNLKTVSENKGLSIWLDNVKADVDYLKRHPDYFPDSTQSQQITLDFPQTKGGEEHEGEWRQLVYTMIDIVPRYETDHLMSTHWGQYEPWNISVPLNGNGGRCPTGNATTAIAQLAYYLHYKIGKPVNTYAYAECYDDWDDYNNNSSLIVFHNNSPHRWNYMDLDSANTTSLGQAAVAALMANVAKETGISFYPDSTSIPSMTAIQSYLTSESINSFNIPFNNVFVYNSIKNGYPVPVQLTSGQDTCYAVIDGVKEYYYYYTYYFQWMPIGTYPPVEPEYPDLNHPELYEIGYGWGDLASVSYKLNWGEYGNYDDGWFYQSNAWRNYTQSQILYGFQ